MSEPIPKENKFKTMFESLFTITGMDKRKYKTDFVRWQQELNSKIKLKLLWDSQKQGTYIRALHGELK